MDNTDDIETLLQAPASRAAAEKLIGWANCKRGEILRGDMMLGILSPETAAKIPIAYETAAKFGRAEALILLGWWWTQPDFGGQDLDAAKAALHQAIAADDRLVAEAAKLELVKIIWFFKQDEASEDEREEAYRLLAQAPDGNAECTYLLALLTCDGFGTVPSPEEAFALLKKAAAMGNGDAMFELSLYYAKGIGVAADKDASFKACQSAAQAHQPRAMYNMGAFHATGQFVARDMAESLKWYELAANAGNAAGLIGMAVIYASGEGVPADLERAQDLLNEAEYCGLDVSKIRQQFAM